MTNEEYINKNKEKDIRSLALQKVPEGVNVLWCLRQIEGWQLAKKKLPFWAATAGLWYPPRLSMEQCSSESAAAYKRQLVERLCATSLMDLTGGFGVDFAYMSKGMQRCTYVERQEVLCQSAQHNFPLLGLQQAEIVNAGAEETLQRTVDKADGTDKPFDVIYLDPARRDDAGRKTVAIEDCTPDVTLLQHTLLRAAHHVVVKLSPMLDISQALRSLHNVTEVHVVSVKGECKELLLVMSANPMDSQSQSDNASQPVVAPVCHCVNLETHEEEFTAPMYRFLPNSTAHLVPQYAVPELGQWLFEPNASIMKSGMQDAFALHYGLKKIHPQSNLFVGDRYIVNVPARQFRIDDLGDFSKQSLKTMLAGMKQANITIRNFPSTVAELRKRWKIKDGGNTYLFVTTILGDVHVIIRCVKG